MFKRKKIQSYLLQNNTPSLFDQLLALYASGNFAKQLKSWGLSHVSIYVDFHEEYRSIDIQAKYSSYYYEWQFDEHECSYMIYTDAEPDEPTCLPYSMFEDIDAVLYKMKMTIPKDT